MEVTGITDAQKAALKTLGGHEQRISLPAEVGKSHYLWGEKLTQRIDPLERRNRYGADLRKSHSERESYATQCQHVECC